MNRLYLALLLTVATASVASNGEIQVPTMFEVAEQEGFELDENGMPIETVPESRQNLNLGTIGATDRLMARITHRVAASVFVVHDQDITFRGVEYTNITAIRVTMIGATQNARPTLRAGGLNDNYATIRILGARGRGYDYTIEIYSAINCSNS